MPPLNSPYLKGFQQYHYLWFGMAASLPMFITVRMWGEAPECDVPVLVLCYVHLHGPLELRGECQQAVRHAAVEIMLPFLVRFTYSSRVETEERAMTPHLVYEWF